MPLQVLIEKATDMDAVRQLWAQYWDEHREDMGAQDLAAEASTLPDGYEEPDGGLLVARVDGEIVGTVGYRRFNAETADMRRLYVPQDKRGLGIGLFLVEGVVAQAKEAGFERMILDVSESQVAARHVYREAGFKDTDGFSFSPLKGPSYMIRDL